MQTRALQPPAPPAAQPGSKYAGKAIRFADKGDRYELVFTDDFATPGTPPSPVGAKDSALTDIVCDMRDADKDRELHVLVGSYGGEVCALNMILQEACLFRHRVGVNLGMADSCGWMLFFSCQERYAAPHSQFMYHEMSCFMGGKVSETSRINKYHREWWNSLLDLTYTREVLTDEEFRLGETTEVFLTGAELIRRKAINDYRLYAMRRPPALTEVGVRIGDTMYIREGSFYVPYKADAKKRRLDYQELLMKSCEESEE